MAAISMLNPKAEVARASQALAVNMGGARGIQVQWHGKHQAGSVVLELNLTGAKVHDKLFSFFVQGAKKASAVFPTYSHKCGLTRICGYLGQNTRISNKNPHILQKFCLLILIDDIVSNSLIQHSFILFESAESC